MKKNLRKMFYLLMLGIMLYAPSAMALTCEMDSKELKFISDGKTIVMDSQIPHTVHIVIVIIQIAIPILLVIFGMLDLFKGITAQKDDEIKKGQQLFIKRLIAAFLVFFVVTIVRLVISFATTDSQNIMKCANCFINGNCAEK